MLTIINTLKQTLRNLFPCSDIGQGEMRLSVMHGLNDKDTSFAIIAVRCNSESATVRRKLERGRIYQLLQGYEISDDKVVVSEERVIANQLYDDHADEGLNGIPHVQFSAIVGKNGSGKSSLIEFLMRMINNAATILKGERNCDPASERLHFVEDVDGDLWYAMDGKCYQLTVTPSASLTIKVFERSGEDDENTEEEVYIAQPKIAKIEQQHHMDEVVSLSCNDEEARQMLSMLFYTLVSNYSIYAYNTNDFEQECCSDEKERAIRGSNYYETFPTEEKCWLHGLFHKNDGYHIPLNITPFRSEGNININVENQLARERLLSLLITQDQYRTINNHLTAMGVRVIPCRSDKYGFIAIKKKLNFKEMDESAYRRMRQELVGLWGKAIEKDLTKYSNHPLYELAVDYLVYKTLKVSKQYKEHHEFYELTYLSSTYNADLLEELVEGESKDHSHITRKIYQTLAFIVLPVYQLAGNDGNIVNYIPFDNLAGRWHSDAVKGNLEKLTRNKSHLLNSAIVPPPFFTYDIVLQEDPNDEFFLFSALSSGEKQQIYAISSILYHLDNLDSIADDKSNPERVFYPHVNIILEEIELYFHPEMQRRFVYDLLKGVQSMRLENLKGINFILVTHSPYVLSDIPRSNVLALSTNELDEQQPIRSFGANIHEMLRTSFFLEDGTEGLFARWEFSHVMACLLIHRWAKREGCDFKNYQEVMKSEAFSVMQRYLTTDLTDRKKYFEYTRFSEELGKKQLLQRINIIDEPVMRQALMNEYRKTFDL